MFYKYGKRVSLLDSPSMRQASGISDLYIIDSEMQGAGELTRTFDCAGDSHNFREDTNTYSCSVSLFRCWTMKCTRRDGPDLPAQTSVKSNGNKCGGGVGSV